MPGRVPTGQVAAIAQLIPLDQKLVSEFLGEVSKTDTFVCFELNPYRYSQKEILQAVAASKRGTLTGVSPTVVAL